MSHTPQQKVSRAVTKAAFQYPFWGSLMLSLGHRKEESIPTACTDGKTIMWNPSFIDSLTEPQTLGLMAHEICHVIFQHCQEWPGKDHKLCNISMDYVINNTLMAEGFELPEGGIVDDKREFVNMTWQQVYYILKDVIDKHEQQENGQEPDYSKGKASENGMSEERQKELGEQMSKQMDNPDIMDVIENSNLSDEEKQDIKQKVIQAAEAAKSKGGIPGEIQGLITEIRTTKVDWKAYLREMFKNRFPDDYTFSRPNKKFLGTYDIYMPSMEGSRVGHIAIGLDTSGSVSQSELVDFLTEMNEISTEFKPEKVSVFYCDCSVAHEEVYEQGEEIDTLNSRGGGGTSFLPVFEKIKEDDLDICQLIYFSDMYVSDCCFPSEAPDYPCLFVSSGQDYDVPFGEIVVIK